MRMFYLALEEYQQLMERAGARLVYSSSNRDGEEGCNWDETRAPGSCWCLCILSSTIIGVVVCRIGGLLVCGDADFSCCSSCR
jgi:hypothetical protein